MINIKPEIVAAFEDDTVLTGLLGGNRVYFQVAPNADEFPRITYYELDNRGSLFSDDQEKGSEIFIVIDIWSKGSTTAIAQQVDVLIKNIGLVRDYSTDLYEDDVKVFHKHMRYKTSREGE